jgi:hypothetical protein
MNLDRASYRCRPYTIEEAHLGIKRDANDDSDLRKASKGLGVLRVG